MNGNYPANPVLLVDDEPGYLQVLQVLLQDSKIDHTVCCTDSRQVLELIGKKTFSLVVLDLIMPHISGYALLPRLVENHPETPVIIVTGLDQVETAVSCIKAGALDYFVKTDDPERLMSRIKQALAASELRHELNNLKSNLLEPALHSPQAFRQIITCNQKMQNIFRYIEAIGGSSEPVLISGESGVGKELAACAVHAVSRPEQPWVAINVAGLDDAVFSDTLFGHVRGSFTGAETERAGVIEKVGEGTLFFDEIGDLSLQSQIKLLRLIQEGEYFPLGSDRPKYCRARFVFSTNTDLNQKIAAKEFRKDLYYRLQTHQIIIPPLRDRIDDLPLLVAHFAREAADKLGKKIPPLPGTLAATCAGHSFPGNIRELRGMVYDAVSRHQFGPLALLHPMQEAISATTNLQQQKVEVQSAQNDETRIHFPNELPTLKEGTAQLIAEALQRSRGNLTMAANRLGITRQALGQRLKRKNG